MFVRVGEFLFSHTEVFNVTTNKVINWNGPSSLIIYFSSISACKPIYGMSPCIEESNLSGIFLTKGAKTL